MDLAELSSAVDRGEIDTVLLALTDMQGRLQGKRFHARHFLDAIADHAAEACNYLMAVDVEMATVDGYAMASWDRGYGDFAMTPDLGTLRPVPWQEGTAMCLADLAWGDGSDVAASPRQVLRRQLTRLAERGWSANAGTELEFQVFRTSYEDAWRSGYRDLDPANLYNVDYSLLGTARVGRPAGRGLQGRVQPRPARDQLPLPGGAADLRRARDLQERRQGDGRPGRHVDHVHGQVRPARGQLVPHPSVSG
jgi:glutamine synthetase